MPELPEVETIRNSLSPRVTKSKIMHFVANRKTLREAIPIESIKENWVGHTVVSLERRGKYLLFRTRETSLLVHFGMSGFFSVGNNSVSGLPHNHYSILFKELNNKEFWLHFHDARRFSRIDLCVNDHVDLHKFIVNLGIEPLSSTVFKLSRHLLKNAENKKKPVKTFLMDNGIVVGIGNIYASETLYRSRINPTTPAQTLSMDDWSVISKQARAVLRKAIKSGGTTLRDFQNISGEKGYFFNELKVYGREGEACIQCSSAILKIQQSGRSTFFCANCQK